MNILQRIAALCGRDYVLMRLPELNDPYYYLMPVRWFDDMPFAKYDDEYCRIIVNGTFFITPRITQWMKAQETTLRLEHGGVSASRSPTQREREMLNELIGETNDN